MPPSEICRCAHAAIALRSARHADGVYFTTPLHMFFFFLMMPSARRGASTRFFPSFFTPLCRHTFTPLVLAADV